MDAVNAFNMELFSMIDMKPPISRAKMMSVTKSAIKAIKLYKHVVQIVEKFIKKCKPELKVPGLYVVDSIVRQSRHQFGVDKDVFGPRFLKNFTDTFQNLYRCPEDDKSKVLRVLNLWQKNGMFDMDIIQPLLDMATGSFVAAPSLEGSTATKAESQPPVTRASDVSAVPQLSDPDALAAVAQLFQSSQGQELQKMLQNFQQGEKTLAATTANSLPVHLQTPAAQPNPHTEQRSSLAKKLLDRFDYDDEPEEGKNKEAQQSLGVHRNAFNQFPAQMPNMESFHPHMAGDTGVNEHGGGKSHGGPQMMPDGYPSANETYSQSQGSSREESSRREGRHKGYGRRSRSGSGTRSPRRRRSRSTSRSRRSRHRHSRSRSRERPWTSHSGSQDRNEREKERERRQKGLPSIKSETLSVCSTTLWVGQLDKRTQQADVMSLLEEFGQIESINMIPPRGCAYIVMVHRQDAYTALHKLSSGSFKVNQKPIKIAWALNKGIKSTHKKFWDVERGVTYVPWSKVKVEELESFREGGMLDADTLNPEWKAARDLTTPAAVNGALESVLADGSVTSQIQLPPSIPSSLGGVPAFSGPIMLSPGSIPPRGSPFIPTGFDPTHMPPAGFSSAAGSGNTTDDSTKDKKGNLGTSDGADSRLGSPLGSPLGSQLGSPLGSQLGSPGPPMMSLGPRPGMPPLQHHSGMPAPHLPRFLPPPNMPHMPHQMMPGGPMFPPDRFRMPMHFPPRGPPFPPRHPMGPESGDDGEGRHFRNGRPGFGCPPFHRGRW